MKTARTLTEQTQTQAKRLVKGLLEGTVIVLNTGNDDDGGDSANLRGAIQNILGKAGTTAKTKEPAEETEETQASTRSGKRWIFKVHRDTAGSITSIEAEES